ncbi:MAG TPA: UPF0261 family protein [Spirochaetes bacterium]|nr:UPF0261 family protein [Spirochaetota bacterium]
MDKKIVILGCMDTKGEEYSYIKRHIEKTGLKTLMIDTGVINPPAFTPDITRHRLAETAGENFDDLVEEGPTRERIAPVLAEGAKRVIKKLIEQNDIHGIISCGGTQGSTLAATVMRELPVGFPKVLVSTMASGDTSNLVGIKDVTMMFSVSDIMGLNMVSRQILSNAAGAICGMAQMEGEEAETARPLIAITTVGITTPGAMKAREVFESAGFDTVVFHAVGTGGRAMESLMKEGKINGVLDLATIEVIQEMLGGYLAATPERMTVATGLAIPQVICPGGITCNTYGPPESIPEKFRDRKMVRHSSLYTNVRTNEDEMIKLARVQAQRINPARGPVEWFIPMRGFCSYSVKGGPFYDPDTDRVYVETLKKELRGDIPVFLRDLDINDPGFAVEIAEHLVAMIRNKR